MVLENKSKMVNVYARREISLFIWVFDGQLTSIMFGKYYMISLQSADNVDYVVIIAENKTQHNLCTIVILVT